MPAPSIQESLAVSVDQGEPWKDDGNIVLCAQGKYFRVHRSVLSDHSEVFKDILSCPHEAEDELVEQCPVIHLHDSAADVQTVLKAIYDRSYYPVSREEKYPFPVVAAFLRLGLKYAINTLLQQAMPKLRCRPDPFNIASFDMNRPFRSRVVFPWITDADPDNVQIMNLMQETGIMAALPLTMYYSSEALGVGGHEFNGSVGALSAANLRALVRMGHAFEKLKVEMIKSAYMTAITARLTYPCVCSIRKGTWVRKMVDAPPLHHWNSEWDHDFCDRCRKDLKERRRVAIYKVWDKLPEAFGFESWAEVKKSGNLP